MDETENKNIAKIYFIVYSCFTTAGIRIQKIKFIVCDELNWHSDKN